MLWPSNYISKWKSYQLFKLFSYSLTSLIIIQSILQFFLHTIHTFLVHTLYLFIFNLALFNLFSYALKCVFLFLVALFFWPMFTNLLQSTHVFFAFGPSRGNCLTFVNLFGFFCFPSPLCTAPHCALCVFVTALALFSHLRHHLWHFPSLASEHRVRQLRIESDIIMSDLCSAHHYWTWRRRS